MKVIIAGGRDYQFTDADLHWLDDLAASAKGSGNPFEEIVTGGASGADTGGWIWAKGAEIPTRKFPADWLTHGKAAGPIRNRQMAEYVGPNGLCILFPGGKGTASMRVEAERVGMRIVKYPERHTWT